MNRSMAVFCLALTVLTAGAATAGAEGKKGEGRGFFTVGMHSLNIDDFNTALTAQGYDKLESGFISLGGAGYGIVNRVLLGGEGHALIGDDISSKGFKVSLAGGYGFFNLGYMIVKQGGLNVYPMVSIGGGGMTLGITEQEAPSFDDLLENPRRGMNISTGSLVLGIGLGADYLFKLSEKEGEIGGIAIGIRAGYNFAFLNDDWMFDNSVIAGGPEIGISGPYIKFMIGGGGNKKK